MKVNINGTEIDSAKHLSWEEVLEVVATALDGLTFTKKEEEKP